MAITRNDCPVRCTYLYMQKFMRRTLDLLLENPAITIDTGRKKAAASPAVTCGPANWTHPGTVTPHYWLISTWGQFRCFLYSKSIRHQLPMLLMLIRADHREFTRAGLGSGPLFPQSGLRTHSTFLYNPTAVSHCSTADDALTGGFRCPIVLILGEPRQVQEDRLM